MNFKITLLSIVAILWFGLAYSVGPMMDKKVYIISPTDGATVTGPVSVVFGLKGMGVSPAGVDKANTGHHHLIIDAPTPDLKKPIAKDKNHMHFGGGQTETVLKLSSGKHSLQLVLGDKAHVPHKHALVSKKIKFTVK